MSPMNPRLLRPKASGVPAFTTKGYSRVWGLTTKSSGNVTGTASSDTGYYAVKWWDNTTTLYADGDTFSKAAAGNQRAFEIYPCLASGTPSGQFDGFDISNNALTKVRAEGVSLGSTAAVPGGWSGKNYNPGTPASYEGGVITNNLLPAAAIDEFYTDLNSGEGHLFVADNPGIVADTPTIATAKGYTVFGSVPPSTALLLNFNGSNGSTTFTDSSPNNLAVTATGGAAISTAQSKFGGASAYFDGNGDYLQVSNEGEFDFGTGDFTIEAWVYPTDASYPNTIVGKRGSGESDLAFVLYVLGGTTHLVVSSNGTSWELNGSGTATVNNNAWGHIALVRKGSTFSVYWNGVLSQSFSSSSSIFNSSVPLRIGGGGAANQDLVGYIDDLRIVKGIALYTANFTPPTAQLGVWYF